MSRRFTLATLVALPATVATLGAHAHVVPYCNGRIIAFFHGSISPDSRQELSMRHYIIMHSRSLVPISYVVSYSAPNILGAQNGSLVATLAPRSDARVLLGWQNLRFGAVPPSSAPPGAEMARYTTVHRPA